MFENYFAINTNTIHKRITGHRRHSEQLYEKEIDFLIGGAGWSYSDIDDMFSVCVPDRYNPKAFLDCLFLYVTSKSSKKVDIAEAFGLCEQLNGEIYDYEYQLSF